MILIFRKLGIAIVPYSPLGRGFFGGRGVVDAVPANSVTVAILLCFLAGRGENERVDFLQNLNLFLMAGYSSEVHRREPREEQVSVLSSRQVCREAQLFPGSACSCLDSSSRGRCGSDPRCENFLISGESVIVHISTLQSVEK